MKTGKLYGVGIGPGDTQYLTLRAADVLRSVDVVFTVISPNASNSVSQSVVDYLQPRGEVRLQVFSMSRDKTIREEQVRANAEAIIAELRAGHDCAFATLGDAMTYSTFGYVLESIRKAIPNLDLEVIPGITSFATLTAKAGTVLVENGEQLRIIPSFRAEMAERHASLVRRSDPCALRIGSERACHYEADRLSHFRRELLAAGHDGASALRMGLSGVAQRKRETQSAEDGSLPFRNNASCDNGACLAHSRTVREQGDGGRDPDVSEGYAGQCG